MSEEEHKAKEDKPWNGGFGWRFKYGKREVTAHLARECGL